MIQQAMPLSVAITVILVCTLLAGGVSMAVHRSIRVDVRRRHHEVGTAVFLQLGVIFAVLLAFVFSEVWSDYNSAASAVELECSSLEGAAVLASALPPDQAVPLLGDERAYVTSVIHEEWPGMFANRSEDLSTDNRLTRLIQTAAHLQPTAPADQVTRQQILVNLEQAHTQRTMRIFQLGSGIPVFLWVLLITFGVVLAAFVSVAGVESGGALISFSMTFAAAVAGILIMIHLLDYPFEGALALPPGHFVYTLQKIAMLAQQAR
jgi:Protein of unknown function (DUF4239)